jgi:hypothetical protein
MGEAIDIVLIDRGQAQADAERESKEADLKQHADKLVRGFENIDNSSYNRAVWELVQNACDLSNECKVIINYSKNGFSFTHNGKPFTSATLISLIKQVSSKYDGDEVGKFGTGFITTHAFGRKFKINSLLDVKGRFLKVKDFLIDRSAREWKGMVELLIQQENQVYELIKLGEIAAENNATTVFTYLPESQTEHEYIKDSTLSLHSYIPIVLTLNDKLYSVSVIEENGVSKTYSKLDKVPLTGFYRTTIATGGDSIEMFSLIYDEEEIEIILPITKKNEVFSFDSHIARLFLYYPLIGTEQWGCNFIIHSKNFAPTEPRDGIHLKSKTEQVQDNEENNRKLIATASQMIFSFISANAKSFLNPIALARINFNVVGDKPLLNEYFQELKSSWINHFKTFPLVEVESEIGLIKPADAAFLDKELLQNSEAFDSIYALVSKFWGNIPKKHLISDWTNIIDEWNVSDIKYLTIRDLVSKIQETGNMSSFTKKEDLLLFYNYLITQGHSDLFNNYKLLPNIKGEFRQLTNLNSSINLPALLIDIADVIMPDIPKRHVHFDFKFNLEFTPYSRKNFTTEINDYISKQVGEKSISQGLAGEYLKKLLDYCKIVTTSDSTSVPTRMIKSICKYYNHDENLIPISELKEDILDVRPPQKRLLRLFLNDLSTKESSWVIENLDFLEQVISTGADYHDYEDMFLTLPVFPNQLNELCVQTFLSREDKIPEKIKTLYDDIVKPKYPIRANLVNPVFSDYLKNKEKRSTRSLTEKIENVFFETSGHLSLNDHPFKKEIVQLIDEIKKSSEYEKYFPLLFSKRSSILVELADSEDTFSILSLDASRIKNLAQLGNNPDFDEIVRLGQEALLAKQQEHANFQHKYAIGTHIEMILRNSLKNTIPENIKAEIQDVQDGQDIIIKINEIAVYFIEVKSRWDINSSIRMSKNQTLRANEQKDNYSLCSVDMTKYKGINRFDVQSIGEIQHCIRFNKNIGYEVVHLIEILNQTNVPDTIHLDGDYRTLVPMKYVENGLELPEFEKYLISFLTK